MRFNLAYSRVVYNSSVNRTMSLNPFEIVTGFKPRQSIDLVSMTHHHFRISNSASAFASHIRALHEKIIDKIMKNNADYKAFVDLQHTIRTFNVGDCVMARLRPERFLLGFVKILHA